MFFLGIGAHDDTLDEGEHLNQGGLEVSDHKWEGLNAIASFLASLRLYRAVKKDWNEELVRPEGMGNAWQ